MGGAERQTTDTNIPRIITALWREESAQHFNANFSANEEIMPVSEMETEQVEHGQQQGKLYCTNIHHSALYWIYHL